MVYSIDIKAFFPNSGHNSIALLLGLSKSFPMLVSVLAIKFSILYEHERRKREPALLFWGVVFAHILFFCPVSSRTTYFLADALQIDARFIVSPVEELMKVALCCCGSSLPVRL
jgi:hypothetical protein